MGCITVRDFFAFYSSQDSFRASTCWTEEGSVLMDAAVVGEEERIK